MVGMAGSFRDALRDVDEIIKRKGPNDLILDRMRGMGPEDPEEYTARGLRFSRMNRYDEAAADYQAAISAGGQDDPEVYFNLGGALSALGRREDAAGALREALRLRPDASMAACALSWELERLGRYGEALEVLGRHMKIRPNPFPCVHHQMGRVYGRQGRLKEAFASYLKAVWFDPPSPDEPNPTVKRRFGEMLAVRRRAKGMDPEDPRSFLRLGSDLIDAGWDDLAVDVLGTMVWSQPVLEVYLLIGELHERYLQLTEAIEVYLECMGRLAGALPPADMAPVYDALVENLFKCGRHQEVLKYGAEAVSLGAAGPNLLKYYTFARDTPSEVSDIDLMVNGWTAPYYANLPLDPDL